MTLLTGVGETIAAQELRANQRLAQAILDGLVDFDPKLRTQLLKDKEACRLTEAGNAKGLIGHLKEAMPERRFLIDLCTPNGI